MANLEQRRASFALEKVEPVAQKPDFAASRGKYKTQLLKLPARLHSNGLGPTVAFYLAAGRNSPEATICGWIEEWLHQVGLYGNLELIHGVTGTGLMEAEAEALYRRASAEVRALAVWLKRFAEAYIEGNVG